jgi:hypothetical protein
MKLSQTQRQWLAFAIVAVVLSAVSIFLGVTYPVPPAPGAAPGANEITSLGTTYFKNLAISGTELIDGSANSIQLTVRGYTTQTAGLLVFENSAGTDELTLSNAGALFVNGTADLRGNLSDGGGTFTVADIAEVTDDTTFDESVIYASTAITPSNLSTLTVDKTFYIVNSSTNVTFTLGTSGAVAGQMLILYFDDNHSVIIADTNVRTTTGGALTMGQYDVVGWIYSGAAWVELYLAADS